MKTIITITSSAFFLSGGLVSAANVLLDFGNPPVISGEESNSATSPGPVAAGQYLVLSPGHDSGAISLSDTSWNTITSSTSRSDLIYGDGSAATGLRLSMGQETTGGNKTISYTTQISSTSLSGTGGGAVGQQALFHNTEAFGLSIYGADRQTSSAVGRDGFFGGANAAVGLRIDGLAEGEYLIYVMARNTNTSAASVPMSVFASAGESSDAFDFGSLTGELQSNIGYQATDYNGEFSSFVEGENFVSIAMNIEEDESLFLAVSGADSETRGFLNMVQIVAIPEPSSLLLFLLSSSLLIVRRR